MADREIPLTKQSELPISLGMKELLADRGVCIAIEGAFPSFDAVLAEIQRAVTSEGNRDTVGPTILSLSLVRDAVRLFAVQGEKERKALESSKNQKS